ncbi:hypothetical protein G7Z17_g2139 [Cylindrodendrum hubeiense]|uniref:Carboxylic ester hydrolase n=1 Tax=Cylindrodendrum hubeiense TaxID=595255 RepID=A0A9P5HNT4_9HYPO|nr:hypothetical protein G7Z17_g2139 [Cylindrodendrum hubeiense]
MHPQIPLGLPSPLHHSAIGRLQGKYGKGVIQYLGIKYASLEDRLAEPQVIEYSGSEEIDATRHGPPVITPPNSAAIEMGFIQKEIAQLNIPEMSDIHGLNLNVTTPTEGGKNLPVIVYIHGGGFTFGSSSYPHYDQSKVIELSAIMDQPLVAINFNYRLGIAGFLTSQELRSAGYKSNRGLLDQRAALSWIKKYVSGFGGDPERLTVVGQSAGAVVQTLGLGDLTPDERVKSLLAMPQEQLVAQISKEMTSLGPTLDGELIPVVADFSWLRDQSAKAVPGFKWCERLLSIESQFDGTIFALVNLNFREQGIKKAFSNYAHESLGEESASKLLNFYGINSATADSEALESIIQFITEIAFYAPSIKLAEAWPGPVFLGHFNERNPWDGPYKGKTNHLLDIAYLWGNYNQSYTRQNWTVARALAEAVVSFVSEKGSLPEFKPENSLVTVYGPSEENISSHVVGWDDERTRRNDAIFQLADELGGLDMLLETAQGFLRA